jgi:hypothetical protein
VHCTAENVAHPTELHDAPKHPTFQFGLELTIKSSSWKNFQNRDPGNHTAHRQRVLFAIYLTQQSASATHTQRRLAKAASSAVPRAAYTVASLHIIGLAHKVLSLLAVCARSLISLLWMLSRASETVQVDDRARATRCAA